MPSRGPSRAASQMSSRTDCIRTRADRKHKGKWPRMAKTVPPDRRPGPLAKRFTPVSVMSWLQVVGRARSETGPEHPVDPRPEHGPEAESRFLEDLGRLVRSDVSE